MEAPSDRKDAEYIPPPPDEVPDLFDDLVGFSARTDLTPVALAALAHAQFELIQPFVDGSEGRFNAFRIIRLVKPLLIASYPLVDFYGELKSGLFQ